ncbi:MAG TPA: trehalose-6-phosphate synthase, partial [Solirubrobacterales bacterium]|nr:trehalose-6-phosphate synthase [Solirubrobacterales bacterium]
MSDADANGRGTLSGSPLVLVSNRGPVTFDRGDDGQRVERRGTGGLVTALTGLVNHRSDTLWVASAMTDEDATVAEEHGGRSFSVRPNDETEYRVRLVVSDPEAYDRFYNVAANPMLWFIQHYLWDLSNAPDVRQEETDAFDLGYDAVNNDLAQAVLSEIEDSNDPIVMVHDYHLYT